MQKIKLNSTIGGSIRGRNIEIFVLGSGVHVVLGPELRLVRLTRYIFSEL